MLGVQILIRFIEYEPTMKKLLGFKPSDEISSGKSHKIPSLVQMGLLVHSLIFMERFDTILSTLGPDFETFDEIVAEYARDFVNCGGKIVYVSSVQKAIQATLVDVLGDNWTNSHRTAWNEVLDHLSYSFEEAILCV